MKKTKQLLRKIDNVQTNVLLMFITYTTVISNIEDWLWLSIIAFITFFIFVVMVFSGFQELEKMVKEIENERND